MRNLKKFLAVVLAMMMVFSLMVTVNAATGDQSTDYDDAIEALEDYKVLAGYEDGLTHPEREFTRAQMAAIIYRVMTGDTADAGNDSSITNYGDDALRFDDVDQAAWAKGYIGFCANHGILAGYGDGTVKPNEYIKGYQVLAMLLRALGYGQNGEYQGDGWDDDVLWNATKYGIPASYASNTYYNKYNDANSASAKDPADAYYTGAGSSAGTKVLGDSTSFARGDMVAAYGVTSQTGGAAFNNNNLITKLVNAYKTSGITVKVTGIEKDSANNEVGVIVGNRTYYYNCTYSYNDGKITDGTTGRLTDTDIGDTFTFYLDAHDNILGVESPDTDSDDGVGVITAAGTGKEIGNTGLYAATISILTEDGSTKTVSFLKGDMGSYDLTDQKNFTTADEAKREAAKLIGQLVTWVPNTAAGIPAGYSIITAQTTYDTITGDNDPWTLDAGDATSLDSSSKDELHRQSLQVRQGV